MGTTRTGEPAGYSLVTLLSSVLTETAIPIARLWVRYAPVSFAKTTLWGWFGRRAHSFQVRARAGFRISGNTLDTIQNLSLIHI